MIENWTNIQVDRRGKIVSPGISHVSLDLVRKRLTSALERFSSVADKKVFFPK